MTGRDSSGKKRKGANEEALKSFLSEKRMKMKNKTIMTARAGLPFSQFENLYVYPEG